MVLAIDFDAHQFSIRLVSIKRSFLVIPTLDGGKLGGLGKLIQMANFLIPMLFGSKRAVKRMTKTIPKSLVRKPIKKSSGQDHIVKTSKCPRPNEITLD